MDALFEYGLTPRSLSAVAMGVVALALAVWGACRSRARRERGNAPVGMDYVKNLLAGGAVGALVGLALGSFPVGLCLGLGIGMLTVGPMGRRSDRPS